MQHNKSVPKDKSFGHWVHIQFGAKAVLEELARRANEVNVGGLSNAVKLLSASDPTEALELLELHPSD